MNNGAPWVHEPDRFFSSLVIIWAMIIWRGRQIRKSLTTDDGHSLAQMFDELAR